MTKKERAVQFMNILEGLYPDALCSLEYKTPLQLLIATMLSAQCTDARVNLVTPKLFEKFPDAKAFSEADISVLEECIHSVGFFRSKSKNIIACCKKLCLNFGGEVPPTMEELLTLDGVGRKTANLILGDVFKKGGMVIDTHAKRILLRVGLTKETDPLKVERDTAPLIPLSKQSDFCHRLVLHGRALCSARKPLCSDCPAAAVCKTGTKKVLKKSER